MIDLFSVSDDLPIWGRETGLFRNVDFHLPPGRYALLSWVPECHRAVMDVLSGVRPPRKGNIKFGGTISWPIGRQGFVRGKVTGTDLINLVADTYGVDRHYSAEVVSLMVSRPDTLIEPVVHWQPYIRKEFIFALGLVPEFDIYVIDAEVPFEDARFTRLWQALFEERLVGKTLVLSTYRPKQMLDYCAAGLIYEDQGFRIEPDLEQCVEQFPMRPAREEFGGSGDEVAMDDSGFFF